MKEVLEFFGSMLLYLVVALGALAISGFLITLILLMVQACLSILGTIHHTISVY